MPIFGDNTAGGDTFPTSGDRGLFGLFTLTEDGTATEIAARFDATSTAGSNAKGVIYTSAGVLVHATAGQAIPGGGGLLTWAIADIPLTAGDYYLGTVVSDFQGVWQCDAGTGQRVEAVTYASPASTMGTLNSAGAIPDVYVTYTAGAAPSVDQEGFRFGSDDGSESAHTWKDAQDVAVTSPLSANILLRQLINGTGDYATAPFKLKYQKNGAGGYVDVPVGANVAESYGTVTFGAIGTGANGTTTVAPQPASPPAGAYMVAVITSGATNSETPTAPDGTWTLLATGASTDGTYGIDTGPRRVTAFGKVAAGTEGTTAVTFSITNGGTCRGTITHFTKSGSGAWVVDAVGANDSTSGTGVSMAGASMNWNTGDATLVATGQRVDSATQSAQSLTASGVTFGTRTNRAATAVTTGNDHRHTVDTFAAVTGTSNVNAAPTWAYTASASVSAGGVIVRLREYTAPVTNELYVATSANIAAGGEATTARLTAPSGKTTSSFTTGRRWDDENGTDSIDIAADFYTELEWCLQSQSPAANGDFYDFRVYNGNTALDTYTVTPRWTIGSGVATITEPATADSTQAATNVTSAARTEATTAADSVTVLDNSATRTEATTADSAQDAVIIRAAAQTDSTTADASQTADGAGAASRTEATTADSAQSAIRATADAVVEGSGPSLGDEQNDYQLDGAGFSPQLVTVNSQNGQYMLICVLGDSGTQQTPTDNKGNTGTISLIDSLNYFADQWAPYNMRVYGKAAIQGGAGHVVSVVKSSSPAAEATVLVVVANGLTLQAHSIARRQTQGVGGGNMVSDSVTTTGPALLVSFWSGDGGLGVASLDTEVLSGTGWTLLRMIALEATAHIQHALAVKLVDAGTHTITWHNLGDQGCIIQLNALQGGGAAEAYAALVGLGASDTAAATAAASHPATLTTSAADTAPATSDSTQAATTSTSAARTEPATADTTQTGSNATTAARTESTTAADASDGTNTGGGVSVTEPGSPADAQAGALTTSAARTEATTAGEASAVIMATAAAITEAVSAGDLGAAIAVLLAALTEPGSAGDSSTASSSSAGSATITEGATAADSPAATQAGGASITEGATAGSNQLATGLSTASVAEPTAPGDTSLPAREAFALDTATATPGDVQAGTVLGGVVGVVETAVAADALAALVAAVATILEAATLTDDQRSSFTVASITEGATAADFIAWIRDIGPTSPRVLTIEAENRVLTIAAEDRKLVIVAENRTLVIDTENRTITVQGG